MAGGREPQPQVLGRGVTREVLLKSCELHLPFSKPQKHSHEDLLSEVLAEQQGLEEEVGRGHLDMGPVAAACP